MLTPSQKKSIRTYLLSKKLPLDILLEVEDHFIALSQDLLLKENCDYETAFTITKSRWHKELSIPFWNLNDDPKFVAKIKRSKFHSIYKLTAIGTILLLLLFFSLAHLVNVNSFSAFFTAITFGILIIPVSVQFLNHRKFQLSRKHKNLSIYQKSANGGFTSFFLLYVFLRNIDVRGQQFYYFFNLDNRLILGVGHVSSIIMFLLYFVGFGLTIYITMFQIRFLKSLKVVRPYLVQQ